MNQNFQLSILVPVYNFDVTELAQTLHLQLIKQNISFEMLLYDDCSMDSFKTINSKLSAHAYIVYLELPKNLGRSKIRNLLAQKAQYDYLLFLDCDVQIIAEDYIQQLLNYGVANYQVVIGGTCYAQFPPIEPEYYLHWLVGKNKEEKKAVHRNLKPYNSFTLNNMLIAKSVYLAISLDERITTYGHEDSKFGEELNNKNISVLHVDNPVCHLGLSENIQFVEKSLLAINNLSEMILYDGIGKETKLFKTYQILLDFNIIQLFLFLSNPLKTFIHKNLLSSKPSLLAFDIFKLNYLVNKLK